MGHAITHAERHHAQMRRLQARFWLQLVSFTVVAKNVLYVNLLQDAAVATAEAQVLDPQVPS